MGAGVGVWEGAVRGGDRDRSGVSGSSMGMVAASQQKCGRDPLWQSGRLTDNSCISISYALIPSEYYFFALADNFFS